MKTKKLKYKPEFEFELIGISTIEDDYKISWAINKCLDIKLQRDDNLEIKNEKKSTVQSFSVFKGFFSGTGDKIKLVANKSFEGFLIEELKNIDFFLVIYSDKEKSPVKIIIKELKSNSAINIALIIDPNKLKSKEKLLF